MGRPGSTARPRAGVTTLAVSQNPGYLETAQTLLRQEGREWNQKELLAAAEAAQLRYTGRPVGVVIHRRELSPRPTTDGIEARIPLNDDIWEDYWYFKNDGRYFFSRIFQEDHEETPFTSSVGHPERALWFDIQILRIAETLLHSAELYHQLEIAPDEPYLLSVTHRGLEGREFYTSTPSRHVSRGRVSQEDVAEWQREVTQDLVKASVKDLTHEIANQLFVLFDFADVSVEVVRDLVDRLISRRL